MKFWKKILIALLALAVVGIGWSFYAFSKIENKIEPELKIYVQLTKEEQDEFVITHMEDFSFGGFLNIGNWQYFRNYMNNDPEFRQAVIDWERSFCAGMIVYSEDIFPELSPEDKAAYYTEKEEYQQRLDRFRALVNQKQGIDSED